MTRFFRTQKSISCPLFLGVQGEIGLRGPPGADGNDGEVGAQGPPGLPVRGVKYVAEMQ